MTEQFSHYYRTENVINLKRALTANRSMLHLPSFDNVTADDVPQLIFYTYNFDLWHT